MRYKTHRKGFLDNALPVIIFIVLVVLAFFAFQLIYNNTEKKQGTTIQKQKDFIDGNSILTEYLTIINDDKNNAEIISESYSKKDYENLKKDMQNYLEAKLSDLPRWHLEFQDMGGNTLFSLSKKSLLASPEQYRTASVSIPVTEQATYVTMNLFYGRSELSSTSPLLTGAK